VASRSIDGGQSWLRWLVERAWHANPLVLTVAPSYPVDGVIFVGLGGCVLKPLRTSGEVRSGERGPVWRSTAVGNGTAPVTALAVSQHYATDRTIFAATSAGVFVSRDSGDSYQACSDGDTPSRVLALAISPGPPR
jgi:hypothetical protein